MRLFESLKSAMSFRPSSTNSAESAASSSAAQTSSVAVTPVPALAQPLPTSAARATKQWQKSPSPSLSANNSLSGSSTAKPNGATTGPASPADFPKFSASTEEILKRVRGANAVAHQGTPGYEAAKQSVLNTMVTSDKITTTPQSTPVVRKRGGSRGGRGSAGSPLANGESVNGSSALAGPVGISPAGTRGGGKGRGGGRGRGQGGGRGGKRKRDDSEESENDSDISESYTPILTQTKSGRQITKPTQFTPALPSPSSGTKRKRTYNKRPESILCKVCSRATSSSGNMIVFCDGCNTPYHQYCHDPPIEKEVVQVVEREWLCSTCVQQREPKVDISRGQEALVADPELTSEEKRQYFSTLPADALVDLLCRATSLHPTLPLFSPNTRSSINNSKPPTGQPHDDTFATPQISNGTLPTIPLLKPLYSNVSNSSSLSSPPTSTASLPSSSFAATATAGGPTSAPANVDSIDHHVPDGVRQPIPYDEDYDTGHYPKPGNGLARTLRPESEDLQWLVDDNFEVFSHHDTYGAEADGDATASGVNGFD